MPAHVREVHSSLFTVRVWPEELEDGRVEWRGKVQSVPSGETLYFRDWDTMMAFIRDSSFQQAGAVVGNDGRNEEGES